MSMTELMSAAGNGETFVVKRLIKRGDNVNEVNELGWTALHNAVLGDYDDIVDLLLKAGATTNTKDREGSSPLHVAASHLNGAIVQLLIAQKGCEVNSKDKKMFTPLMRACEACAANPSRSSGALAIVQALIDAGADVKQRNSSNRTALHLCRGSSQEIAELLVSKGCPVEKDPLLR